MTRSAFAFASQVRNICLRTLDGGCRLNSGYEIPALGLGTWKLAKDGGRVATIKEAIRIGYRHIDCAKMYGNEKEIGQELKNVIDEKLVKREELFVTSKLWNDAHATDDVRPALESTLRDLQLGYLDLYLIHWPVALKKGHDMPPAPDQIIPLDKCPIEATWTEMEKAVDDGLVRSIGVSNFSILKLSDLLTKVRIPPAVNQVECHPYLQQEKLKQYCDKHGVHVTAYGPLGAGHTTLLDNVIIKSIASKLSVTPAQVLLAWALAHGHSAICKSSSPERLQENFDARNLKLSKADLDQMKALECGHRFVSGEVFFAKSSAYTYEHLWDEEKPNAYA
ncbi:hypothetical protein MPSEU_000035800 [Mayamaea pseudoterrestris]|nr:hypothetical protein MPSEU_000035800 [Mayamaea pseudoterrestris]